MRHRFAGKQLSRSPSHRRAMRRNMAASLIEHGSIRTTKTKAKELRRFVERLITTATRNTLHARRQVLKMIQNRHAVDAEERDFTEPWVKKIEKGRTILDVLFDDVAPRYADRPGGYTRIIRISDRRIGDAGEQVILQLVEESSAEASSGPKRRRRRAAKRHEAAAAVTTAPAATETTAQEQEPTEEAPEEQATGESSTTEEAPRTESAEQEQPDEPEESDEKA